MFVKGMVTGRDLLLQKRNEGDPFAIRRDVREPVMELPRRHGFLVAAVCIHLPQLHGTRAVRIEVNELAVRSVFRSVIQTFRSGQLYFRTTFRGNPVDVELIVSLPGKYQAQSVGRPAVAIRGSLWCY